MQNIINTIIVFLCNTTQAQFVFTNITMYNIYLTTALILLLITHKLLSRHNALTLEKIKAANNDANGNRIAATTVRPTNKPVGVYDIHTYHDITNIAGYDALNAAVTTVKAMRRAAAVAHTVRIPADVVAKDDLENVNSISK